MLLILLAMSGAQSYFPQVCLSKSPNFITFKGSVKIKHVISLDIAMFGQIETLCDYFLRSLTTL